MPTSPTATAAEVAGKELPTLTVEPESSNPGQVALMNRVGRALQAFARGLSDEEIRQHIADCGVLYQARYARFERLGDPNDREEAILWLHRMQEAQRALSPAGKAAREAEIQRAIDDGLDYFSVRGAADRQRMEGRVA